MAEDFLSMFDKNQNDGNQTINGNDESKPSTDPEEQMGYLQKVMEVLKEFDRVANKLDQIQKRQEELDQMQKHLEQMHDATKNFRVRLSENDQRQLDQLPQQVSSHITIKLDEYIPQKIEQVDKVIKDDTLNACKEIKEIKKGKGIWISEINLYIITILVLSSLCFGGWGVAQLGDSTKVIVFWAVVLFLPISLWIRWLWKEKIFPKDDMKYPWRW